MEDGTNRRRILVIVCALFAVSSAMGVMIASDNFDYPLGTTIAPGETLGSEGVDGFLNAWKFTTHSGEVVANLKFPGVESSGNALKVTRNNTGSLFRGLSSSLGGTYYVSMIFYRNDANNGGGENWRLELRHSAAYAGIDTSSVKYQIGSSSTELVEVKAAGAASSSYGTTAYTVGTPVFMLAKVVTSDSGPDTVSMKWYNWLDSVPETEGDIVWDATSTGEFVPGAGWKLILPTYIGSMIIDEFRVGTELSDVVPPGGPSLLVHDSFDYPLGTTIATNGTLGSATNGFSNAWKFDGCTGEVISNLTFSGVESSGNALKISNDGAGYLFRGMTGALTAGTYYMSSIFFRNDTNEGSQENWRWEIKHASSHTYGPGSSTKISLGSTSAEQVNLQVAGDSFQVGTATYNLGVSTLLLTKIMIDDSGAETASMRWYNNGETMPTNDVNIVWDATSTGQFSGGSGWKFLLGSNNTEFVIDEFRLGRTLASVVPSGAEFIGYDLWSVRYALTEGADGDDDSDGLSNLYEYGLGGDPTNSTDQGISAEYRIVEEGGTNWFSYVYPSRSEPDHGLLYYLEVTDNLTIPSWVNSGYVVSGTNVTSEAFNYVSNRVSMVDADQQFIRLVIEQE